MKIAIFSLTKGVYPYVVWGVQMHVYNLARHLQKKGHDVTICCAKHSIYDRGFYSLNRSIDEHDLEGIKVKIAHSYRGLEKLLLECNSSYDVLHIHAYRSIPISPRILEQLSIPIVFTPHAIFPPTSRVNQFLQHTYDRFLGKPLLYRSDIVIALNRKNMMELEQLGTPTKKIIIIPNSVDCEEFTHIPAEGLFREKYGVNKEYILFNGRIVEHKGVHILLKAIKNIQNKLNLELIIVGKGEGNYLKNLLKFIQNNGLESKVLILDTLEREMQLSAYSGAKMFVLPSFQEGLPTVLLEAMAMGKICIASKTAGYDLIDDHVNGYSFSTGDSSELSEVIVEVNETGPQKLDEMRLNAKSTIKDTYNWAVNVSKVENVYAELIKRC